MCSSCQQDKAFGVEHRDPEIAATSPNSAFRNWLIPFSPGKAEMGKQELVVTGRWRSQRTVLSLSSVWDVLLLRCRRSHLRAISFPLQAKQPCISWSGSLPLGEQTHSFATASQLNVRSAMCLVDKASPIKTKCVLLYHCTLIHCTRSFFFFFFLSVPGAVGSSCNSWSVGGKGSTSSISKIERAERLDRLDSN